MSAEKEGTRGYYSRELTPGLVLVYITFVPRETLCFLKVKEKFLKWVLSGHQLVPPAGNPHPFLAIFSLTSLAVQAGRERLQGHSQQISVYFCTCSFSSCAAPKNANSKTVYLQLKDCLKTQKLQTSGIPDPFWFVLNLSCPVVRGHTHCANTEMLMLKNSSDWPPTLPAPPAGISETKALPHLAPAMEEETNFCP